MLDPVDYRSLEPAHLNELAGYWFQNASISKLLGDTENLVWRADGPRPFVVRLVHPEHRSREALASELCWLQKLTGLGLAVCEPLKSRQGHLIEEFSLLGQNFYVSAFEWIEGQSLKAGQAWSMASAQALGKLVAQIHLQGRCLSESQLATRPDWRALQLTENFETWLSPEQHWLIEALEDQKQQLQALPQTPEHYGLIHGDIHDGNFKLLDQQPVLFDFDDCHLGWYAQDLALILFSASYQQKETDNFEPWFIEQLKLGYRTIRSWPELFVEAEPLFARWREIQVCLFILRRWPEPLARPASAQKSLTYLEERLK